jgi:membrane associated rhomboid family serine protease
MYSSIISDIRRAFHSNMISKIVTVNVGVFVLIGLVWLGGSISHSAKLNFVYLDIVNHLSVSENFLTNLKRPWTYLSYMFVHRDVFHLLWNMVMLVWFGRIIGDFLY